MRTVRKHLAGPARMKVLTNCQANRTRVGVRTVRRHPAKHAMESLLTCCQGSRTRVGVRTVRRHSAGHGLKSPTSYEVNGATIGMNIVRLPAA